MEGEFDIGGAVDTIASQVTGGAAQESQQTTPQGAPPALKPLPKAWKKEMEAHWSKLPPEIHDYVYEREGNVSKGIQTYREGHENWSGLLAPYQEVLAQFPDVRPRELLNNLLQSHLALAFGDPATKQALA